MFSGFDIVSEGEENFKDIRARSTIFFLKKVICKWKKELKRYAQRFKNLLRTNWPEKVKENLKPKGIIDPNT